VVAHARLIALVLMVACLSATTQTGSWRGPADIACVGEGHSMRPDRRRDELIAWIAEADDHEAFLPPPPRAVVEGQVPIAGASSPRTASLPLLRRRHAAVPRGPPIA
jgi:hypothetical protein